jgi:integrase/recombinase XerD
MFWGELRRGEIIGLKPEDLDWRIPRIIIRHALASALEEDGVPLRQIQDMLGHSDPKTTKRYLHDTADHINKMGKRIEKMGQQDEPLDGGISRAAVSG